METTPDHFCPGCGKQLSFGPRNPWYFCGSCISKATDANGQAIQFIGMGAEWCYRENHGPDAHDRSAIGVICLISGRPVIVQEARQGGQVAEPVYKDHFTRLRSEVESGSGDWKLKDIVDLTDRSKLDAVVAKRLVRPGRKVKY
jgi:hypothetical protein